MSAVAMGPQYRGLGRSATKGRAIWWAHEHLARRVEREWGALAVIRPLHPLETHDWLILRGELWPDVSDDVHRAEMDVMLADESRYAVFVAVDDRGDPAGFAEVSIRSHAEFCTSHPVGYLEGWFVREEHRGGGHGRGLVKAATAWAREKGCVEMASDSELTNAASRAAHGAAGFEVVGELVHYRRRIDLDS